MIVSVNIFEVCVVAQLMYWLCQQYTLNAHQNFISHLRSNQGVCGMEFVLHGYCWELTLDGLVFIIFWKKITSWVCSEGSRLKLIFH